MNKRYNTPFDNFEAIRRKARRMVDSGEMTQEESSAWIEKQDAEEYAETEARAEAMRKDTKPAEPTPYYEGADPVDNECMSINDDEWNARFKR